MSIGVNMKWEDVLVYRLSTDCCKHSLNFEHLHQTNIIRIHQKEDENNFVKFIDCFFFF